jgi:hypothetical protein
MIKHYETCGADYPEKPDGEPPQFIVTMDLEDGDVVHQCSDCGAFEIVSPCVIGGPIGMVFLEQDSVTTFITTNVCGYNPQLLLTYEPLENVKRQIHLHDRFHQAGVYEEFSRQLLASIGSSFGVSFDVMSANYERATASQVRLVLHAKTEQFQRTLARVQARLMQRMTDTWTIHALLEHHPCRDRIVALYFSADPRQRKRGRRLYAQAVRRREPVQFVDTARYRKD